MGTLLGLGRVRRPRLRRLRHQRVGGQHSRQARRPGKRRGTGEEVAPAHEGVGMLGLEALRRLRVRELAAGELRGMVRGPPDHRSATSL